MPAFSKMMSSYPFQLIRGLGKSVRMGAGIGAGVGAGYGAMSGRNRGRRAVGFGAAGALLGGGGVAAARSTFARNMMRPGIASMLGGSAVSSAARRVPAGTFASAGRMADRAMGGATTFMRSAAARIRGLV